MFHPYQWAFILMSIVLFLTSRHANIIEILLAKVNSIRKSTKRLPTPKTDGEKLSGKITTSCLKRLPHLYEANVQLENGHLINVLFSTSFLSQIECKHIDSLLACNPPNILVHFIATPHPHEDSAPFLSYNFCMSSLT